MKTNQTTRQHRRVVWLLVEVVAAFLLAWVIGRAFLLRTSLLSLAPDGTDLAIDLVGKGGREVLVKHFSDIELVSNRPITTETLAPDIGREVTLYFDFDAGTHSVAFSGQVDEKTQALWKSYGVSVTSERGFTFLSESDAIIPKKKSASFHLAAALPHNVGVVLNDGNRGSAWYSNNKLSFNVYTSIDNEVKNLPTSTIAMTQVDHWPGFEAYGVQAGGSALLVSDENGIGYKISIKQGLETQMLAKLVQDLALRGVPGITTVSLPDTSTAAEIRLDPKSVDVQISEQNGKVSIKASTKNGAIFASQSENTTIISNRERLVDAQDTNGFYLAPKRLLESGVPLDDRWQRKLSFVKNVLTISIFKGQIAICW